MRMHLDEMPHERRVVTAYRSDAEFVTLPDSEGHGFDQLRHSHLILISAQKVVAA